MRNVSNRNKTKLTTGIRIVNQRILPQEVEKHAEGVGLAGVAFCPLTIPTPFVMIMVPFIERIINLVIQNKPQTSIEEASLAEITTQI